MESAREVEFKEEKGRKNTGNKEEREGKKRKKDNVKNETMKKRKGEGD